jgi:hypothetical protein
MRRLRIVTLTLAAFLGVVTVASADNLVADGDNAAPIDANSLSLGTVCVNSTIPVPAVTNNVLIGISRNGNYATANVYRKSTTVSVAVLSTTGTGLSATMVASSFTMPSNWDLAANNTIAGAATSKVSLAAGSTAGPFSGTVNYRSTGTKAGDGSTLTRDTTLNVTATISDTGACTPIPPDTDAPTIICTPNAADGVWYPKNVIVNCTASDDSGLAIPAQSSFTLETGVAPDTEDASASTNSLFVCDTLSNCATAGPITGWMIDRKAPQLTSCDSADGQWYADDVTLKCHYIDGGAGPANQDVSLSTNEASGTETSNASASAGGTQACDAVSNCADSPADITGNMIDKKAPHDIAFVGSINDGDAYYFGSVPANNTCTATDDGSGLASCSVTGYGTGVGAHTLTATASDNVENSGSASIGYSVLAWTLNGFYQPVDMGGYKNTVKGGSTVPLKFNVFAGATELTNTSAVKSLTSTKVTCGGSTLEDAIEATVTGGTSLRYDATGHQFIYNWQTPKTPGVCYRIVMKTQDESSLSALFMMK